MSSVAPGTATAAGILLAAGGGSRFGMPKALIEFEGCSLAERAIATLKSAQCDPVIAVVGARADEVRSAFAPNNTEIVVVENTNWPAGMGGSVRQGLAAAGRSGAQAAVMLPVDQPLITSALVERLLAAWHGGAIAAVATFADEMCTPVLLDRSLWPEIIRGAVGDSGARIFLRSNPELVTVVDCDDVGDPLDIDTEQDVRLARTILARSRQVNQPVAAWTPGDRRTSPALPPRPPAGCRVPRRDEWHQE